MRAPLMSVFRAAHAERDAKRQLDLRDEHGERVVAGRRSKGRAELSEQALQRAVTADIENLLNAVHMDSTIDLSEFPAVQRSVLNYGLADVAHRSLQDWGVDEVSDELREALLNFEPRLIPESVTVERDLDIDDAELRVRFIVRADLACDPLNIPVQFIAELERESGQVTVGRG